jgi:hypothetical protein
MALEETDPNIQRRSSTPMAKPNGQPLTSTPSIGSNAVQSMLRNTTELGDVGQFSSRFPRDQRSAPRLQGTGRRTGSSEALHPSRSRANHSPRYRSSRRHGPRQLQTSSTLPGRDTLRSQTSLHSDLRSRRAGNRHKPAVYPNGLAPPNTLHGYHSMVTLRSQQTFQSIRSNSSLAPPGQRRPRGHRAPSPAYSEAYPPRHPVRPGGLRVGSVNTATSSPASMPQIMRPGLPGYRPEMNHSFTSSAGLPSPALSFVSPRSADQPSTYRSTTPMSSSLQTMPRAWNHRAASSRGLTKSPTESSGPNYYDYSESFLEEDCFSPSGEATNARVPFDMDQTIMEDEILAEPRQAQSPFGTSPGSPFSPLELPTGHNRTPSEQSRLSKHSYAGVIPPRSSSLVATSHKKSGSLSRQTRMSSHVSFIFYIRRGQELTCVATEQPECCD